MKLGEQAHDIRIKRHDELSDKQLSSLPDCYESSLFTSLTSVNGLTGWPGMHAKSPGLPGK
ncbi:hypothetical protein XAR_4119 [Xanthomonas citri pv. glycines str. 8ra]|nr:hypothetical protein XAR_4119 [Xanthomonas citri pv. glycines str. 8ra]